MRKLVRAVTFSKKSSRGTSLSSSALQDSKPSQSAAADDEEDAESDMNPDVKAPRSPRQSPRLKVKRISSPQPAASPLLDDNARVVRTLTASDLGHRSWHTLRASPGGQLLGISLGMDEGQHAKGVGRCVVFKVREDSAAAQAGVPVRVFLTAIDGQPTDGTSLEDLNGRIRERIAMAGEVTFEVARPVPVSSRSAQPEAELVAIFDEGPLGLGLAERAPDRAVTVTSVDASSAAESQGVEVGYVVRELNDQSCAGLRKAELVDLIKAAARPCTLKFTYPAPALLAVPAAAPAPEAAPEAEAGGGCGDSNDAITLTNMADLLYPPAGAPSPNAAQAPMHEEAAAAPAAAPTPAAAPAPTATPATAAASAYYAAPASAAPVATTPASAVSAPAPVSAVLLSAVPASALAALAARTRLQRSGGRVRGGEAEGRLQRTVNAHDGWAADGGDARACRRGGAKLARRRTVACRARRRRRGWDRVRRAHVAVGGCRIRTKTRSIIARRTRQLIGSKAHQVGGLRGGGASTGRGRRTLTPR